MKIGFKTVATLLALTFAAGCAGTGGMTQSTAQVDGLTSGQVPGASASTFDNFDTNDDGQLNNLEAANLRDAAGNGLGPDEPNP